MKCSGCEKEGKMICPRCLELSQKDLGWFCDQDCFKRNWAAHKLIHALIPSAYNPWPGYTFTGKLRPYPYSETRLVPSSIAKPDYAATGIPVSENAIKKNQKIEVQSPETLEKVKKACKLAREVLDTAAKAAKVGVTTDEIDRVVHEACIERDSYPSPLNYHGFPKSCCTSVNEVICHGIPDKRPLEDGDILNIDISLFHDGHHGDLNETYLIGNVDEKGKKLVDCARKCLDVAIEAVRPGVLYRDIGDVIQKCADAQGFSVVRTYCGHGINTVFHGPPTVPHYAKNRAVGTMKAGHIFTIEPMINEGVWQDEHWPDNWTAVTRDGKRSAQFEHTLSVTDTGCDILTK